MYDSVFVTCPHCKAAVEFKSLGGDCLLNEYYITENYQPIPAIVAIGLHDAVVDCTGCGGTLKAFPQASLSILFIPP